MDGVIQISLSGAAMLVVGLFGLVFSFGLVLLRQFEARVAVRDEAAGDLAQSEREARAGEMREVRASIANEAKRIGFLSEQIGDLLEVDKRLRVIEEWRRHVPTNDGIGEIKGALSAVQERSDNTLVAVRRIEQYLMEQR